MRHFSPGKYTGKWAGVEQGDDLRSLSQIDRSWWRSKNRWEPDKTNPSSVRVRKTCIANLQIIISTSLIGFFNVVWNHWDHRDQRFLKTFGRQYYEVLFCSIWTAASLAENLGKLPLAGIESDQHRKHFTWKQAGSAEKPRRSIKTSGEKRSVKHTLASSQVGEPIQTDFVKWELPH